MKKQLLWYLFTLSFLIIQGLSAQSAFLTGFRYQAVLRDSASQVVINQEINLKISIIGDKNAATHYSEFQKVTPGQSGLFELIVGGGDQRSGSLTDLPWGQEQLWLQIEMLGEGLSNRTVVNTSPLMAVPYALHAATTTRLEEVLDDNNPIEKSGSQSIYWTTSGNLATNPAVHFVGSRDNVNVVFKTNGKAFMTLTPLGKLQLISEVPAGPDSDKSFYPTVVEGTLNTQGVWVEINGSRAKANNFVTFADDNGIQGRIEGQTLTELENSDSYKTMVEVTTLNTIALTAKVVELTVKVVAEGISSGAAAVACGLSLGICVPCCLDIAPNALGAVASGIKLTAWIIELAAYITATTTSFNKIRKSVGVSFSSGSGDYAEWLLRNPAERDLVYGEIVSVNGGMVSLNTTNSTRNMVVSQYPAFLGKTPADGNTQNYEKIAFLGQVPVRIVGKVNSGDFILPSGKNDGLGKAVNPKEISIADYGKIVGVAWETINNDLPFNLVNIGVGLRSNQLASKVDELEHKVDDIMNFLEGKNLALNTADPEQKMLDASLINSGSSSGLKIFPAEIQNMSDAEFDQMIDDNAEFVETLYSALKLRVEAQGHTFTSNPTMASLFNDPVNTLKKMHRNPNEFLQKAMANR